MVVTRLILLSVVISTTACRGSETVDRAAQTEPLSATVTDQGTPGDPSPSPEDTIGVGTDHGLADETLGDPSASPEDPIRARADARLADETVSTPGAKKVYLRDYLRSGAEKLPWPPPMDLDGLGEPLRTAFEYNPHLLDKVAIAMAGDDAAVQTTGMSSARGSFDMRKAKFVGPCKETAVHTVVSLTAHEVMRCYDEQLRTIPNLAGRLSVRWTIARDGSASDVSGRGSLKDEGLKSCVLGVMRQLRFEAPRDDTCAVEWLFAFHPER